LTDLFLDTLLQTYW